MARTAAAKRLESELQELEGKVSSLSRQTDRLMGIQEFKAAVPEELVRRDPMDDGELMWGCHYDVSNDMASIADTTGEIYLVSETIYKQWDDHLTKFVSNPRNVDPQAVKTEGLKFLFEHALPVYDMTLAAYVKGFAKPFDFKPTDNEIRDFFCWLYRKYVEFKSEGL